MIKKLLMFFTCSFFIFNCFAYSTTIVKAKKETVQKMAMSEIEIIPISEMNGIDELKNFKQVDKIDTKIKLSIFEEIKKYKNNIAKIDLVQISEWAKKEMKGYKLPENFYKTLEVKNSYRLDGKYALNIKSVSLPVHNPLVKRFLYIIPIYDFEKNKIEKIYITIKGYVEE